MPVDEYLGAIGFTTSVDPAYGQDSTAIRPCLGMLRDEASLHHGRRGFGYGHAGHLERFLAVEVAQLTEVLELAGYGMHYQSIQDAGRLLDRHRRVRSGARGQSEHRWQYQRESAAPHEVGPGRPSDCLIRP